MHTHHVEKRGNQMYLALDSIVTAVIQPVDRLFQPATLSSASGESGDTFFQNVLLVVAANLFPGYNPSDHPHGSAAGQCGYHPEKSVRPGPDGSG